MIESIADPESEESEPVIGEREYIHKAEESQDMDYTPYLIGGVIGALVLGALVFVVLRWKK